MNEMRKLMETIAKLSENEEGQLTPELFNRKGYHLKVRKGKFMPSETLNGKVVLHDLENVSPETGKPKIVTFDDGVLANKAAQKFGGVLIRTKFGTYRIIPRQKDTPLDESYYSRLATAIDELVAANPKLTPVQLVGKARIELGDEAAKYLSDKFESEGDFLDYDSRAPAAKNPVRKHMKGLRKLGEGDVVPFPTTVPYEQANKIMTVDEYYEMRGDFPPHDVDFDQEPGIAYVRFKADYSDAADWNTVEEDEVEVDEETVYAAHFSNRKDAEEYQSRKGGEIKQDGELGYAFKVVKDVDIPTEPEVEMQEDGNIHAEDPISQQIASLLAQGKQVISNIAGAMGRVTKTDGRFVYIRHPGRQEGVTSFDSDPKVKLVGGIDHYKITKDYSNDQGILGQVARNEDLDEATGGTTVKTPIEFQGRNQKYYGHDDYRLKNLPGRTRERAEEFVKSLGIDDTVSHDVVDPESGELLFQVGTTKRTEIKKGNYQKLNHADFTRGAKLREPEAPIMHGGWDGEKDFEKAQDTAWELLNDLRDSDFYHVVWRPVGDVDMDTGDEDAFQDYDTEYEVPVAIKRKDGKKLDSDDHDNMREIVRAVKNGSTMQNTGVQYVGMSGNGTVARFVPSFF